jgi:tetratricopeptide (TPR) repeat protein
LGAALVASTFIAYLPVWRAGFIWDDDTVLLQNAGIQTAAGLARLWSSDFPLSTTTFWLEWRLWGANPLGYHVVNVLLHALSAVLLWRVLARLRLPGAWLAAAIFAVHPVNVESVAWIAERKNTLCMAFYLLSLLWYVRSDAEWRGLELGKGTLNLEPRTSNLEQPDNLQPGSTLDTDPSSRITHHGSRITDHASLFYALSLLAFALALLSKTAVAPLPVVLLGAAWWRRGRLELRDVWRSVPFFALGAAMGLLSLWYQTHQAIGASMIDVRNESFWTRLAGAGWAVWFYLYKALLPLNLSFIYPRWRIDKSQASAYVPGLLLAAAFVLCWWYRRQWGKPLLLGLGYFVLMLLPILGFVNIYFMRYSLVADHWQYFAIIGPIALAAAGITRGLDSPKSNVQSPRSPSPRPSPLPKGRGRIVASALVNQSLLAGRSFLYAGCCGVLVVGLGVLAWRQARTYTDLETLWMATLARNPRASIAHNNLGNLLLQKGRLADAIGHFQTALSIQPKAADVHSNLGGALLGLGRLDEAIAHFQAALKIQPDSAQAHNNLGNALQQQGRLDQAIAQFQQAVDLQPGSAGAHYNLGGAFLQAGRVDEAMAHLQRALELQPDLADAHMSLGNALYGKGEVNEAIAHFQRAAALQPNMAGAQHNLANALFQQGQVDEAITHFQKALAVQPNLAVAHNGLGNALLVKGQVDSAIAHFRTATRLQPKLAEAHLNLANALLQSGKVDEAIAQFQTALALQPDQAGAHNNLANALLSKGRVDDAIAHFRRALSLQPNLAEAHNNLANALLQKGRAGEAVTHYEAAMAVLPNNPRLLSNLASVLATCPQASVRNGVRAVELAQQAVRLTDGNDPSMLGTLAAAYAEAGRFPEAITTIQNACALASGAGDRALLEKDQQLLKLYRQNKPYREAAVGAEPSPPAKAP